LAASEGKERKYMEDAVEEKEETRRGISSNID
jgi:hypothetical protein